MLLYEGRLILTVSRARRGVSYKYVLVHKGRAEYEALPEFPSLYYGDVNRFLRIPDKYLKANGKTCYNSKNSVSEAKFLLFSPQFFNIVLSNLCEQYFSSQSSLREMFTICIYASLTARSLSTLI